MPTDGTAARRTGETNKRDKMTRVRQQARGATAVHADAGKAERPGNTKQPSHRLKAKYPTCSRMRSTMW